MNQPDRLLGTKIYLHKVGTDPSADREFFSMEKYPELGIQPEEFPNVEYDKNNGWLFASVQTVDSKINNFIAPVADLEKPKIQWQHLFHSSDEVFHYATTDKDIYFLSGKNAPRMKLMKTALANPEVGGAVLVVPETLEKKIWLSTTSGGLFFTTNKNGVEGHLYHLPYGKTTAEEVKLPFAAGSVNIQTKGFRFPEVWVNVSGWTRANERYRYDAVTGNFIRELLTTEAKFPEFDDLVVEEIMVPSHDGAQVPLSLVYKKGLKQDGTAPVLLGGYGAYGASISPFFHPTWGLLYTLEGGIFAIAHVRGGGELGQDWHLAGQKSTKPNTWKDLIACSEFLIKNKYTSAKKITIQGASAGGILIGRAMTERPDLFAAAIPEVGCLNPMRQEFSANGPGNVSEFGTVKDSVECMALLEMDAYHHLKPGVKYPATLITAGMNDPRVPAWEPGKFSAQLQAVNASDNPILFFPDFDGGHGLGDTKIKGMEKAANMLSFGLWQSGVAGFQPQVVKP